MQTTTTFTRVSVTGNGATLNYAASVAEANPTGSFSQSVGVTANGAGLVLMGNATISDSRIDRNFFRSNISLNSNLSSGAAQVFQAASVQLQGGGIYSSSALTIMRTGILDNELRGVASVAGNIVSVTDALSFAASQLSGGGIYAVHSAMLSDASTVLFTTRTSVKDVNNVAATSGSSAYLFFVEVSGEGGGLYRGGGSTIINSSGHWSYLEFQQPSISRPDARAQRWCH